MCIYKLPPPTFWSLSFSGPTEVEIGCIFWDTAGLRLVKSEYVVVRRQHVVLAYEVEKHCPASVKDLVQAVLGVLSC